MARIAPTDVLFQGMLRVFLTDGRDVGHLHPHAEGWSARLRIADPTRTLHEAQVGFPTPEAALSWLLAHPGLRGDRTALPGARKLGDGVALAFWHDGAGQRLALLEQTGRWGLTTRARLRTRRRVRVALLREGDDGRDSIVAGLSQDDDGWRLHRADKGDLGPWADPAQALAALARAVARDAPSAHARLRIQADAAAWPQGLADALRAEADPDGAAPPAAAPPEAAIRLTRRDGAAIGLISGGIGAWTARPEIPAPGPHAHPTRRFAAFADAVAHLLADPRLAFDPRADGAEDLHGILCLPLAPGAAVGAVLRPDAAARRLGLRRGARLRAVAWADDARQVRTLSPDAFVLEETDGRLRLCQGLQDRGRRIKTPAEAAQALARIAGGASAHAALALAARAAEDGEAWWRAAEALRLRCMIEIPEWTTAEFHG